jgi:hypothetical protein
LFRSLDLLFFALVIRKEKAATQNSSMSAFLLNGVEFLVSSVLLMPYYEENECHTGEAMERSLRKY